MFAYSGVQFWYPFMGRISRSCQCGKFKYCPTDMEPRALSFAEEGTSAHPVSKGKGQGLCVHSGLTVTQKCQQPFRAGAAAGCEVQVLTALKQCPGRKVACFSRDNVFFAVLLCIAPSALLIVTSPGLRPVGAIDRISFIRCKLRLVALTCLKENSEVRRQWEQTKIPSIQFKHNTSTFYVTMVKHLNRLPKQAVVPNFRIIQNQIWPVCCSSFCFEEGDWTKLFLNVTWQFSNSVGFFRKVGYGIST